MSDNQIRSDNVAGDKVGRDKKEYEQHLAIAREIGDRRGEGTALGNLGVAYRNLGEARRAMAFYEQDLAIAREMGDRRGEGQTLGNLGSAYAQLGEMKQAETYYVQCCAIARAIEDAGMLAENSWELGVEYEKQGNLPRAAALMQPGVDYKRQIGHTDAEQHAARLEAVQRRIAEGE